MTSPTATEAPLLKVENLRLTFSSGTKNIYALRGVDLTLQRGEILALVGESGSGKSVTGLSLLGLHGKNAALKGRIGFDGRDLSALSDEEMRAYRGKRIAMIFQEPMTALNPVFSVGFQLGEVLALHR